MAEKAYVMSFIAGLFSVFSPCIIPMIIMYFTVVTGMSFSELERIQDKKALQRKLIYNTLVFIIAYSIIWTLAGAVAGRVGKALQDYITYLNIFGGTVIILLGLRLMGVLKLKFLAKHDLMHLAEDREKPSQFQYVNTFLVGIFFAIACSHCIAPTLYSTLSAAGASGSPVSGMAMMLIFSLGLALPYMIIALFMGQAVELLKKLRQHQKVIEMIMGAILIIFGLFFVTNKFTSITQFFFKFLPKLPIGM